MTAATPAPDTTPCPLGWKDARCGRFGPCGCEPPAPDITPGADREQRERVARDRLAKWLHDNTRKRNGDVWGWWSDELTEAADAALAAAGTHGRPDEQLTRYTCPRWHRDPDGWCLDERPHLAALAAARPDGDTGAVRDALLKHHPIAHSMTGALKGCRCGAVKLGQDVIAHVVAELRAALGQP